MDTKQAERCCQNGSRCCLFLSKLRQDLSVQCVPAGLISIRDRLWRHVLVAEHGAMSVASGALHFSATPVHFGNCRILLMKTRVRKIGRQKLRKTVSEEAGEGVKMKKTNLEEMKTKETEIGEAEMKRAEMKRAEMKKPVMKKPKMKKPETEEAETEEAETEEAETEEA